MLKAYAEEQLAIIGNFSSGSGELHLKLKEAALDPGCQDRGLLMFGAV
jgi:hypothetical protein